MAWLQNLAGRAEDLLNKIDQNAATVLSEGNGKLIENSPQAPLITSSKEVVIEDDSYKIPLNTSRSTSSLDTLSGGVQYSIEMPSVEQQSNDKVADTSVSEIVMESRKPSNGSSTEENVQEKSIRSDQMSASSTSLHNSFIINEELESLHEKIAKLEHENQDLNKQLLNMHHLYSEIRNENSNLQFNLDRTSEQLSAAQKEKDQYVARAQKILQEKEKLISLKQQNSVEPVENVFITYNEELKKELEFQQEKNNELVQQVDKLTHDVTSLQMQHQIIQNGLHQSNQSLEQSLLNEKRFRSIAEEECLQKNKEIQMKTQELSQLQEMLKLRNDEIKQLKEALKRKDYFSANEDLESRLRTLTQALMLKQNTLETVTTEKNALCLQLEKLEAEYKNNLAQLKRDKVKVINIQESNDDRFAVPQFMRVSPFDAGVTRRVKHAYSTLDAISVRTGIFLRRYPLARVFVFSYMVILHMWVLCVLFLYAPSNR